MTRAELIEKMVEGMESGEICVLCGGVIEGYGNNPYPLAEEGRCCDLCNMLVVEERIKRALGGK